MLEQAVHRGGGVTVPGDGQELCGCGTDGHGQSGHGGDELGMDKVILVVFSNCNDSMPQQHGAALFCLLVS